MASLMFFSVRRLAPSFVQRRGAVDVARRTYGSESLRVHARRFGFDVAETSCYRSDSVASFCVQRNASRLRQQRCRSILSRSRLELQYDNCSRAPAVFSE